LQIQKAKPGYKLVKSLFGKYEEIPEDWEYEKLSEKCIGKPEYGANVSAIEKNPKLPRYIRITDLNDDGSLRNDEWKSISENDAQNYFLNEGDIIFARTGATVGKTYLYQKKDGWCAFAGYLIRFIPDSKKLNSNYLFHYTHSFLYWQWLKSIQTWGVQPNVNAEQYSQMEFFLPPISQQQKIAAILSNVDSLIESHDSIIEKTKKLNKGLMQQLYNKINNKKNQLGELLELIIDHRGITPKKLGSDWVQDGVPVISAFNIKNFKLTRIEELRFVEAKIAEKWMPEHLQYGDVLITSEGATLGQVAFFDRNEHYVIGQRLFAVRPKRNMLDSKFLYYYLTLDEGQKQIFAHATGTTTGGIRQTELIKIKIPLPEFEHQQKIAAILSNLDFKIFDLDSKKTSIVNLKKGLLQKLLTGQIRV